jgi:hypothetical protein
MDGWMDGWIDGWMDGNKKEGLSKFIASKEIQPNVALIANTYDRHLHKVTCVSTSLPTYLFWQHVSRLSLLMRMRSRITRKALPRITTDGDSSNRITWGTNSCKIIMAMCGTVVNGNDKCSFSYSFFILSLLFLSFPLIASHRLGSADNFRARGNQGPVSLKR